MEQQTQVKKRDKFTNFVLTHPIGQGIGLVVVGYLALRMLPYAIRQSRVIVVAYRQLVAACIM